MRHELGQKAWVAGGRGGQGFRGQKLENFSLDYCLWKLLSKKLQKWEKIREKVNFFQNLAKFKGV